MGGTKKFKTEPVTDRLVKTLPHPDRKATVGIVRFSDDGSRLLTSGYPSGIVQVWDMKARKETTRLNTPSGLRSTMDYAIPTPDWTTILVHTRTRKVVRQEKDGKVHERLQVDGRIDRYDLATGQLKDSIPMADRGPAQLFIAPGGQWALVNNEGSFATTVRTRPVSLELVDLASKKMTKLLDDQAMPKFTPDGKTAYLMKMKFHQDGTVTASLAKFDLASGKEMKAISQSDKQTYYNGAYLSSDGKWLFASEYNLKTGPKSLVMMTADTLQEVARIPAPKDADRNTSFGVAGFSADGKTMLLRCGGPLVVWGIEERKELRSVPVGKLQFSRMAVSPDGKRVAVAGMPKFPTEGLGRNVDPSDLPQPRVELIDVAEGKGETRVLMLPHGAVGGLTFSPDGRTLAVGSTGGVHLLDVSK